MRYQLQFISILITMFTSTAVHAYIGPGAGLSAIGSILALICGLLLLVVGFLWYPLKRLFNKKNNTEHTAANERVDN